MSPRKGSEELRQAAALRHARAEAQRERLAAEEVREHSVPTPPLPSLHLPTSPGVSSPARQAERLRAVRGREEAVRSRKEAQAAEKRLAMERRLARAEASRGETVADKVKILPRH